MPRGAVRTLARRDEIISACEQLYAQRGFNDVTIRDIGDLTSFTRTSIYNYFGTKEEIFLALLRREYIAWAGDLDLLSVRGVAGRKALAEALAGTLDRRQTMLRLMSTSLFEMEERSRPEALTEFKRACKKRDAALDRCLASLCPEMDAEERKRFTLAFLPFVYGVYAYSTVAEKHRASMAQAALTYDPPTLHELIRRGAAMLLGSE